ncbi:MAG: VWA domain-containing protein [Planctomycetes bacterium]|nr:VWA domain-containing protein [Planctomycetota bacterium]
MAAAIGCLAIAATRGSDADVSPDRGDGLGASRPFATILVSEPRAAGEPERRAAAEEAHRAAGALARVVLPDDEAGRASAAALESFAAPDLRLRVGAAESPNARPDEHTILIEERKLTSPTLLEVRFEERVAAGRPAVWSLVGDQLLLGSLQIEIDGRPITGVPGSVRAGGELEVTIPPMAAGVHVARVAGRAGEPPVEVRFETRAPSRVAVSEPNSYAAAALAAQGFHISSLESFSDESPPACVVLEGARWARELERLLRWTEAGTGIVLIGEEALAAAQPTRLSERLPARWVPRPKEKPPEPPVEEGEPEEADAPPEEPPPAEPTKEPAQPVGPPAPAVSAPMPKAASETAVAAIALVIDRSGSMVGRKMALAKEAALATAQLLAADDYLTVVAFDNEPEIVFAADLVGAPDKVRPKLDTVYPRGGTLFYPALRVAADQLRRTPAGLRHAILITDGATHDKVTAPYRELLTKQFAEWGITLSTVFVVGEGDQDPELLGRLALWGRGKVYPATEEQIPAIVTQEVRRATGTPPGGGRRAVPQPQPAEKQEPPPKPAPPKPAPPKPPKPRPQPLPPSLPPEPKVRLIGTEGVRLLEGLGVSDWKPISGFCELAPRLTGAALVRTEAGVPVLVVGAARGGSAALLGIEQQGGFSEWAGEPNPQILLARLAHAVGRSEPAAEPFSLRVRDGVAWTWGSDLWGWLGESSGSPRQDLGAGRAAVEVGSALTGETEPISPGWRRTSLRRHERRPEVPTVGALLASLPSTATDRGPAEPAPPASPPDFSRHARPWILAAAVALLAAILSTRRND